MTKKINDLTLATPSDSMQFETDIGGATANKIVMTALATYVSTKILAAANTWTGQQTFNTSAAIFGVGTITPKIYPAADSTTAIQFLKADGTTSILNVDTTNGKIGIGTTTLSTLAKLTINPNTSADTSAVAQINTVNTTDNGLTINQVASPTGKPFRVTNSSGSDLFNLTARGNIVIPLAPDSSTEPAINIISVNNNPGIQITAGGGTSIQVRGNGPANAQFANFGGSAYFYGTSGAILKADSGGVTLQGVNSNQIAYGTYASSFGQFFINSGAGGSIPTFGTVAALTVNPNNTRDNAASSQFNSTAVGNKVAVFQGFSGQTANILEAQNSGGTYLAAITSAGIYKTSSGNESTGAGSAALGSNSPAITLTAPYKWLTFNTSDGSTVYAPVWK